MIVNTNSQIFIVKRVLVLIGRYHKGIRKSNYGYIIGSCQILTNSPISSF